MFSIRSAYYGIAIWLPINNVRQKNIIDFPLSNIFGLLS